MKNTDVLIVGSGIAGLSLAIKLATNQPKLKVCILTKKEAMQGSTRMAQGGIAGVTNLLHDSYEEHIQDTLNAGGGLCDESVVEMVVKGAPERLAELLEWGVNFDTNADGSLNMALEGGHSKPRVLHHADKTGLEIEHCLWNKVQLLPNIELLEHTMVIDLWMEGETCVGVKYLDQHQGLVVPFHAHHTVLATGGCGQVFNHTTNPDVATGDGFAIASRAGANLANMRFIQFHPTALFDETGEGKTTFLLSEALRGYGAYVVNHLHQRFLFDYDVRGELATRDVISNAIHHHVKQHQLACVYLDLRHLNAVQLAQKFPAILTKLQSLGFDVSHDLIPIMPSAHYACGGVSVTKNGRTTLQHLYAVGETACTGLHGKNRLASNSLLEALVFAHHIAHDILTYVGAYNLKLELKSLKQVALIPYYQKWVQTQVKYIKKETTRLFSAPDFLRASFLTERCKSVIQEVEHLLLSGMTSIDLLEVRNLAQTALLILADMQVNNNTLHKQVNQNPISLY